MGSHLPTVEQSTSNIQPDLCTDCTMSPVTNTPNSEHMEEEAMSRTHQYRKVMKPLLERKRRARINACLDELKDLMVFALQTEGESISKLEKADVLELTVKHLRQLKRQQMLAVNPSLDMDRFRAGYTTCATEVSRCLASTGVDISVGSRLMSHLGNKLNTIEAARQEPLRLSLPEVTHVPQPSLTSLTSSSVSDQGYSSGRDLTPSPSSSASLSPSGEEKKMWRPF